MAGKLLGMGRARAVGQWWSKLPREELLDVQLRDLELEIPGTALEERVETLHAELQRRGMCFRPYVWLSTDWFTPDGLTGFAIPFYLAHPRLARLERREMLEVEGGTREECMRLLRHEAAHAFDNAYRLRRKKRWREVFGRASLPYRQTYTVRPDSRAHVVNLDSWYAQSHPSEDFAETFAVWLRPKSRWRSLYAGTPAERKLEFVEEIVGELGAQRPDVRSRKQEETLKSLGSTTLREHYEDKKSRYQVRLPSAYDRDLRQLFPEVSTRRRSESAAGFLRRVRARLRHRVAARFHNQTYLVDQVLKELVRRARLLELRKSGSDEDAFLDVAVLLASIVTRFASRQRAHFSR